MSDPFLGEIKIVSFNFPPKNWALCNGQFLPINQNQALFSLLGTMYGGNGQTTFCLPNLRGRVPMHAGSWSVQGQMGGEEAHILTISELPAHTHALGASSLPANQDTPAGGAFAAQPRAFTAAPPTATMAPNLVSSVGGSQPHTNMQPYLVLNFVIALAGIFPSRS